MKRLLQVLLLVAMAGLPLAADELRFTVTLGQEDVSLSPDNARGYDDEWDENMRYEIGAFSNLGWIWGFGFGLHQAEVSSPDGAWSLDYESYIFRTYVGKAPVQTRSVSWEILLYSGAGLSKGDLGRTDGFEGGDDSSFFYEVGAMTNVSLNITEGFVIGAGGGYGLSEVTLDVGGTIDLEQQGFYYQGFIGYRF